MVTELLSALCLAAVLEGLFLFVAPGEVAATAARFGGAAFDVDGVFWSHRGEACTFDTLLEEFGLRSDALDRLGLEARAGTLLTGSEKIETAARRGEVHLLIHASDAAGE